MKKVSILWLWVAVLALASTASTEAGAGTSIRTSDWRLTQPSLRQVIYLSDYNGTYGTSYAGVAVGL